MILLNLFTAVVLENFEVQEEQAEWTLTPGALEVCSASLQWCNVIQLIATHLSTTVQLHAVCA